MVFGFWFCLLFNLLAFRFGFAFYFCFFCFAFWCLFLTVLVGFLHVMWWFAAVFWRGG